MKQRLNTASISLASVFCVLVGFQSTALADLITIEAEGRITDIYAAAPDGTDASSEFAAILPFGIGSSFTASITYDLSVPDEWDTDPSRGKYDYDTGGGNFVWNIDGTTFSEESSLAVRLFDNSTVIRDTLYVIADEVVYPAGWDVFRDDEIRLILTDDDEIAFGSDALPTVLNPADFEQAKIYLSTLYFESLFTTPLGSLRAEDFRIGGTIDAWSTSRTVSPIPVPGAMLLMASGLIGLVGFRKALRKVI